MASITPTNGRAAFITAQNPHTYWELNSTNLGTNYGRDTSGNDDNTAVGAGGISTQQSYDGMNSQNDPPQSGWLDTYIVTDAAMLLYIPAGLGHGTVYGLFHNGGGTHAQGMTLRATTTGVEIGVTHNEGGTNQDALVHEIPDADLPGWFCVSGQFASEGGAQGDMGLWINGTKERNGTRGTQLAYGSGNPDFGNFGGDPILTANVLDGPTANGNWSGAGSISSSGILIANFAADNPNETNSSPAGGGDVWHTDYYDEHVDTGGAAGSITVTPIHSTSEVRSGPGSLSSTAVSWYSALDGDVETLPNRNDGSAADAVLGSTTGSDTNDPTYNNSGDLPVFDFDGNNDYIELPSTDIPSITATTGACTVVLSGITLSAFDGFEYLYSTEGGNNDGLVIYLSNGAPRALIGGNTTTVNIGTSTLATSTRFTLAIVVDNGTMAVYSSAVGLSSTTSITGCGSFASWLDPQICGRPYNPGSLPGDQSIGDILLFDSALTEADLDDLAAELETHVFPLPGPTLEITVSTGQNIGPTPIASGQSVTAPTVTVGTVDVSPTPIASGSSVTAVSSVSPGPVDISPTAIASGSSVTTPALPAGAVDIAATAIGSTVSVGSPALTSTVDIAATALSPTASLTAPSLSVGAVDITATPVASTQVLGDPTLSPGVVNVTADPISPTPAFGAPSLTPGAVTISPDPIGSGSSITDPSVLAGGSAIVASPVGSTVAFGTPTLAPGPVGITATPIAAGSSVTAPTVTADAVADQDIAPTPIVSTSAVTTPTLTAGPVDITATPIASTSSVTTPNLTAGPVGISATPIASAAWVTDPTLTTGLVVINPDPIASNANVGTPQVNNPFTEADTRCGYDTGFMYLINRYGTIRVPNDTGFMYLINRYGTIRVPNDTSTIRKPNRVGTMKGPR